MSGRAVAVLAIALLGLQTSPVHAKEVALVPPMLTVIGGNGVRVTGKSTGTYDFGKIESIDAAVVSRPFRVRNSTGHPVVVSDVETACGCVGSIMRRSGRGVSGSSTAKGEPIPLAPGEELEVQLSLDLGRLTPGPVNKQAWVHLQGSQDAAATLLLSGQILSSMAFIPAALDFGRITAEASPSLELTAIMDARFGDTPEALALAGSKPYVKVTLTELKRYPRLPDEYNGVQEPALHGRPVVCVKYRVQRQHDAPLGLLNAYLTFGRTSPPAPLLQRKGETSAVDGVADPRRTVLQSALVRVDGEVTGSVRAEPKLLLMGPISKGSPAAETITLKSEGGASLAGATATCESRWLALQVKPETIPGRLTIEVRVSPDASIGSIEDEIRIALPGGQKMVVPIWAVVGRLLEDAPRLPK